MAMDHHKRTAAPDPGSVRCRTGLAQFGSWLAASLAILALAVRLGAQLPDIRLSTSVRKGSFLILLDSSSGKAPAALQCVLVVPPAVTLTLGDIRAGSAASSAEKALTCAPGKKSDAMTRFTCILAGGPKLIPNGPVLTVYYKIPTGSGGPPIRIAIEKALGVAADGKPILAAGTQAILDAR